MPAASVATDPIGLAWIVTVRWTTLVAGAGAIVAGRGGLDAHVPANVAAAVLGVIALSNLWLTWRVRHGAAGDTAVAGGFICADVLLLSWLLLKSGGVLNPASAFYLVQIVVAALVLGRVWTGVVTLLSVGGYAVLFLSQTDDLRAAQGMHPEIGTHIRGMWMAFALVAVIVGVLVTRLALAIERRDLALNALRDRNARAARAEGLATVVAGAAHELSTPLATIAVAARELELAIDRHADATVLREDAQLIGAEIDRCRKLLAGMAGRLSTPLGEAPEPMQAADAIEDACNRVAASDRSRLAVHVEAVPVVWPRHVVSEAIGNVMRNALQASGPADVVEVRVDRPVDGDVRIVVTDRGRGMPAEDLARAGEPFFTTKPQGHGIGLGLFVTRATLAQLGGTLELTSTPGRGTVASLTLPANVVGTVES